MSKISDLLIQAGFHDGDPYSLPSQPCPHHHKGQRPDGLVYCRDCGIALYYNRPKKGTP